MGIDLLEMKIKLDSIVEEVKMRGKKNVQVSEDPDKIETISEEVLARLNFFTIILAANKNKRN